MTPTLPPITSVVTDGAFDLFVTNAGGSDGANLNPAVPITISNGPGGPFASASVGVAAWPGEAVSDPADLVRVADKALYRAKAEGRNRVMCHT